MCWAEEEDVHRETETERVRDDHRIFTVNTENFRKRSAALGVETTRQ